MSFRIDPTGVETRVIADLVDFGGLDVLEVGCGDGRMTWRYAGKAASVHAVDVDEAKIETARRNSPEHLRSKISFEAMDISRTELPSNTYQVAILAYSL